MDVDVEAGLCSTKNNRRSESDESVFSAGGWDNI